MQYVHVFFHAKVGLVWYSVFKRHIQQYLSYKVTGQLSSFQTKICCPARNAMDS